MRPFLPLLDATTIHYWLGVERSCVYPRLSFFFDRSTRNNYSSLCTMAIAATRKKSGDKSRVPPTLSMGRALEWVWKRMLPLRRSRMLHSSPLAVLFSLLCCRHGRRSEQRTRDATFIALADFLTLALSHVNSQANPSPLSAPSDDR